MTTSLRRKESFWTKAFFKKSTNSTTGSSTVPTPRPSNQVTDRSQLPVDTLKPSQPPQSLYVTNLTFPVNFPTELIIQIVSFLYDPQNPKSLSSYSLISTTWLGPCRRLMFREVIIKTESHAQQVVQKFTKSDIRFLVHGVKLPQITPIENPSFNFFGEVFKTFPNVIAVDFIPSYEAPDPKQMWVAFKIMANMNANIQYLSLSSLSMFYPELEAALEKFTSLRYLSLSISSHGMRNSLGEPYHFLENSVLLSRLAELRLEGVYNFNVATVIKALCPPPPQPSLCLSRLYLGTSGGVVPLYQLASAFQTLTHFYFVQDETSIFLADSETGKTMSEQLCICWENAPNLKVLAIAKDFLDVSLFSSLPRSLQIMRLHFIRPKNEFGELYDLSFLENLHRDSDFPQLRMLSLTSGQRYSETRHNIKEFFQQRGVEVEDGYASHRRMTWPDWNF